MVVIHRFTDGADVVAQCTVALAPVPRGAHREAGKPRVKAVCGTFYEELCKVENGITFPSMALDLALDTGKGGT